MSLFYLLPPRPLLGEQFASFLQSVFPGLDWDPTSRTQLADLLGTTVQRPDVFVVFRDELPFGEGPTRALMDGFGAEPGDEIIEVRPGTPPGGMSTRRWRLDRAGKREME
jgi:hypothetical protein